ncbi:MAG: response regulator [Blautia faecis]
MIDVLVAEDEFGAREQIKLLVGRFQEFRLVGEADNGDSALELLGKLQPDLILTDIRMPGKNGLDLLRKAAEVSPGTEGVIISGYSDFEYAQSAIQLGCRDYILKPISPKSFRV